MDYAIVFALGALIGIGELVARYRDAPLRAIATQPAALYVALNGVAATLALILVRGLDIKFGMDGTGDEARNAVRWIQILGSGFGAMAIFRSSVFTVRVGDQDVAIGPSSFLQIILGAADRAVDRIRAKARATLVSEIMEEISFGKSKEALPAYCLALMQNLPEDDQKALGEEIGRLSDAGMDEEIKVLVMGLALMNSVGPGVLQAAVNSLDGKIKGVGGETIPTPEPSPSGEANPLETGRAVD